jgi:hypothetical protein
MLRATQAFSLPSGLRPATERLRLSGLRQLRGLVSFYLICALGAAGNVGIASYVFAGGQVWWVAGIAGAAVGSVWKYAVSSVFTWRGAEYRSRGTNISRPCRRHKASTLSPARFHEQGKRSRGGVPVRPTPPAVHRSR